jgi:L-iditol 2-dehydrogenase
MFLGPGNLEVREVPIPRPGPGEVLVKVRAAPTCGTDLKTYLRGHPNYSPPFLFGHEFGGDVVEVGAQVSAFRPGMRVTANFFGPCGRCFLCVHHQENLCEYMVRNWGCYAEYLTIPEPIVRVNTFEIPLDLSYAQAALVEPLASVVHGHQLIRIRPGERVAILGAGGPVGLLHLQMALRCGASQIIAIDRSTSRLSLAKALGATTLINPELTDTVQAIRDLTGGRGADVVIESAGTKMTWELALNCSRRGGRILWFGGLPSGTKVELDATQIHYNELALFGVHGGTPLSTYHAFELITSGAIQTQPLISGEMALEQVEEAFHRMMTGEVLKIAINPNLDPLEVRPDIQSIH